MNIMPSVLLNTRVKLPDVAFWRLTQCTNHWMNILWMEEQSWTMAKESKNESNSTVERERFDVARVTFRSLPDCSREDLHKVCKLARDRISPSTFPVIHYNDHSEPRFNSSNVASFWLNDDTYSSVQIESSMAEVQNWINFPAIFVIECDTAEIYPKLFEANSKSFCLACCSLGSSAYSSLTPTDLFSCLLSTPVQVAYDWHFSGTGRIAAPIPGDLGDKYSLYGQLEWILTITTDAIARYRFSTKLFERLFHSDLLVATLFRRFMLAERIMKKFGCIPVSYPPLPESSGEEMWVLWDRAMDRTIELAPDCDKPNFTLINGFLADIMEHMKPRYTYLIAKVLTYSKYNSDYFDVFNQCWENLSGKPHLQDAITREIVTCLNSVDQNLFEKIVMFLTNILSTKLSKVCHLKGLSEVNLLSKLPKNSDNDFCLRTIFLQLVVEKNFPSSADSKQLLTTYCSKLMDHPNADIRMGITLLAALLAKGKSTLVEINVERLFRNPEPRMRAVALEAWAIANKNSDEKDGIVDKILSIFVANCSPFLHGELTAHLRSTAVGHVQELVSACKQEQSNASGLMNNKSKSKKKHNRAQLMAKSYKEAEVAKLWRVLNSLSEDPEMHLLVSFIRRKATENDQVKKKARKRIIDELMLILPERKSFLERSIQGFFDSFTVTAAADDMVAEAQHEGVGSEAEFNDTRQHNPSVAALKERKSIVTQHAPDLIGFGPGEQLAIAFRDHVCWQSYSGESAILKSTVSTGTDISNHITSLLPNVPPVSNNLLVGHSDGTVRIWQTTSTGSVPGYSWQALYGLDAIPSPKTAKVLFAAFGETLLSAGAPRYLRMWDLAEGWMVADIDTGTDHPTTAIECHSRQCLAVGAADGGVRLLDLRASNAAGKMAVVAKHRSSVRRISVRPDGMTMMSACSDGVFYTVDLRKPSAPLKQWTIDGQAVDDIAFHKAYDIVACAGESTGVYSTDGELLCDVNAELKRGPSSCVAFHPNDAMLCVGYKDNTAVLYSSE
ncbi:protein raptor homolog [Toxorhynchites rutilus septentrionalis]|uniref:protein raptor homolog n=1 Tax=Toxorhynchites rutilus septentrionalis TaxID=329112 RepID=UPI002478FEB4|nr:protein raptor homolog [Toxorhynchites rutilus septentrionalis]